MNNCSTNNLSEAKTEPREGEALPCLNSHISIENNQKTNALSANNLRTAHVLRCSVLKLAEKYGIENLGFLTLTFSQHILCPKEAQRRLNSLISNVIKPRYLDYLGVFERQKSGRIHYHLLVALPFDIRTGVNFAEIMDCNYQSASAALRSEWSFWRNTAKKYGFGRTELLPVKSTEVALINYLGKYIGKHVEAREERDKGVRVVRYSQGARAGTTKFMFHTEGARKWRLGVQLFADIVGEREGFEVKDLDDMKAVMGKRWAYNNRGFILSLVEDGR